MPISWLTVLKSVPWTDVVSNAPKVAEGARKLWGAATGRRAAKANQGKEAQAENSSDTGTLEAQLDGLQIAVADLQNQMAESSELIKALADQNTQLIRRIEIMRARMVWLAILAVVAGAAAVGTMILRLG